MRDWVLFQGLPEAAVHRKTTRDNPDGAQRPARKRCPPGNAVLGPGNRLHILRLEERGPIVFLVSDNFLLWSSPQSVDLHGNKAKSRGIRRV